MGLGFRLAGYEQCFALTPCGTLGKFLYLSEPQFLQLENGHSSIPLADVFVRLEN